MKIQNCFSADKMNQSHFKYAAILLMFMTLAAWANLFNLSSPIWFHCTVLPSNCKILSRELPSQPPAQNIVIVITISQHPAHCSYEHSPAAPTHLRPGPGELWLAESSSRDPLLPSDWSRSGGRSGPRGPGSWTWVCQCSGRPGGSLCSQQQQHAAIGRTRP